MHVSRHEMEALMLDIWETPVIKERVSAIDFQQKVVTTDKSQYRVARQIIDCSGSAMVVAHLLGEGEELWPVYATWAYFDVVENDQHVTACRERASHLGDRIVGTKR